MVEAKHHYPPEVLDEVQAFLLTKASKRTGKVEINQKEFASQLGMEKTRFHRILADLVATGRARELGTQQKWRAFIISPMP